VTLRHVVRRASTVVSLAKRPVLCGLAGALSEAWPGDTEGRDATQRGSAGAAHARWSCWPASAGIQTTLLLPRLRRRRVLATIPAPGGGGDSGLTWAEGRSGGDSSHDRVPRFVTGVTWIDGSCGTPPGK